MKSHPHPHLTASLGAIGIVAALLATTIGAARWIEKRSLRAEAPHTFSMKNHGIALQREAFRQPGLLPLYGSSELVKNVSYKAADFFADSPTGFEVFPVGKAGTASLITLEKLGALGGDVRGRKLAFSISPSWFWSSTDNPSHYAGNFSLEQVNALVFNSSLDRTLKRDVARRVLDFPETLEKSPLLIFALRRLAGDTWWDRAGYRLAAPLGWLDGAILRAQDHLHTVVYLVHRITPLFVWRHHPIDPKWARLFATAEGLSNGPEVEKAGEEIERVLPTEGSDHVFRQRLARASEWSDLDLLLRTLHQLGARPLLLSAPFDGEVFDHFGVSAAARAEYYDRLEALAARYEVPLVDFREHDEDARFLADTHDHLSAIGWLHYNAALDNFYHDRALLVSAPK